MHFDDYKTIQFHRRERVLYVTFNRPEVLNA
ncbi:enoyl-CoA hydratase/isomerase family protein, partial [Acidovorax cavernicola]